MKSPIRTMIDRSKYIATSILSVYRDIFDSELQLIEEYILDVSDKFDGRAIDLRKQYSSDLEDHQIDAWENEYFRQSLDFPKLLYGSMLIAEYTVLEKTLKWIVSKASQIFLPSSALPKKKGLTTVTFYLNYLQKNLAVDSITPDLIQTFEEYNRIRNLFAHSNGSLNHEKKETVEIIKMIVAASDQKLIINEHTAELIIDDPQWLIKFSSTIRSYLTPIFNELIKRHTTILKEEAKNKNNVREIGK